jgi:hypothetical protein
MPRIVVGGAAVVSSCPRRQLGLFGSHASRAPTLPLLGTSHDVSSSLAPGGAAAFGWPNLNLQARSLTCPRAPSSCMCLVANPHKLCMSSNSGWGALERSRGDRCGGWKGRALAPPVVLGNARRHAVVTHTREVMGVSGAAHGALI